jgi:transposase
MILLPACVRVWLATGYTDMRKGFPSLALQVQAILHRDPLSGHLFCFRGRRGNPLKVIWHDGQGACLFTKRLGRGRFLWAEPGRRGGDDLVGAVRLSAVRHGNPEPDLRTDVGTNDATHIQLLLDTGALTSDRNLSFDTNPSLLGKKTTSATSGAGKGSGHQPAHV